jgi:hypothetical protein
MEGERITIEEGDADAWMCVCGNKPTRQGFYPCDDKGNATEPDIVSDWAGLYRCDRCDRIIQQDTLAVVGRNPHPMPLGAL